MVDVEFMPKGCGTALFQAAQQGFVEVVRFLVEEGKADVDKARTSDGSTPLFMAAFKEHTEVVRFLVEEGKADVDKAQASSGVTPLFVAAQFGHLEVIKLLLDKGADWTVGMRDNGWSPLFVASWAGNAAAVAELLGRQAADPATATTSEHLGIPAGSTALSVAELQGHGDVAAALRSAV